MKIRLDKEKSLNNYLQIFRNKDVIVEIINNFKSRYELYNLNINYNYYNGFIYISDYTKKNNIKINITTVSNIDLKREILKIRLDDAIIILKEKTRRQI